MIKNRVKEKSRAGQSSLGTWIGIGHQEVAEILSQIGFDWLMFDTEHAPLGIRGCGPRRVSRYGLALVEYLASANEEILVAIQVETEESLENLDKILSVEGVDVAFIGPADLSLSLGIFGEWENPTFKQAIEKVLAGCKKYRVTPGIYGLDVEDAKARINQGFRFVGVLSDVKFLIRGSQEALMRVRGKD